MRIILFVSALVFLSGCVNPHNKFYHAYVDARTLPNMQLLASGENPSIYSSTDLKKDVKVARSRYFNPIGASSFNGELASESQVIKQAKDVGALLVLVKSDFAETRVTTTPLFIPNNTTTVYNGTTNGTVNGAYGGYGTYKSNTTGSATTYGTAVVPMTNYQQRYNQEAVFFVKYIGKRGRIGVQTIPLTPELKTRYQRNTGALIDVVNEDSPAFEANLLPDDIIIEINGIAIIDANQIRPVSQSLSDAGGKIVVKILRDGVEKSLDLQIKPI
jgi:serine protease Do